MAGQARREHPGRRPSSRDGSSWPAAALASEAASGSDTATATAHRPPSAVQVRTRATYRNLMLRGLAPDEAANLTAFIAGIAVGHGRWTLRQINQLLFLREMNRTGHFTEPMDAPPD
jgi:hypothetical protein